MLHTLFGLLLLFQPTSFTLVIDAGHGGRDPGGMGANSREKNIVLSVAQQLATEIGRRHPEVRVLMTRQDDTFIPLRERAAIANRSGADLFVSIHANIMPGSTVTKGTETFVMGQHVAAHNLAVAKRENASILLEDDYEKHYDYDPNSPEGHILLNMVQHAHLERSIRFAAEVERQFGAAGRKSRGVKQAGFVVLKETTMPAVLVELGFMSCPEEEAYLLSSAGQRELTQALVLAFSAFYDGKAPSGSEARWTAKSSAPSVALAPTFVGADAAYFSAPDTTGRPYRFSDANSREARLRKEQPPGRRLKDIPDSELTYALQLHAGSQPIDTGTSQWQSLPYPIRMVREKGLYKYQLRGLRNAGDVREAKVYARQSGFRESMAVVYYRGQRLPQAQVRELMGRR